MQKRFEPTQPGACDRMGRRLEETIFVRKSLAEPQATPQWVAEDEDGGFRAEGVPPTNRFCATGS